MRTTLKRVFSAAVILSLAFLFSCSSPGGGSKQIQITRIGWVLENVDPSYWSDGFSAATCFGWFSIAYTGDSLALSDIQYARMSKSGSSSYYSFLVDSSHVDLAKGRIYGPHFYTTSLASNGSAFPIGLMEFEIGLTNGYKATYLFDIPAPANSASGGMNAVYNEDYLGVVPGDWTHITWRPSCTFQSKLAAIAITFTTSDPTFYNGYVIFYDSVGNEVGTSPNFRIAGAPSPIVSAGLYTNGTDNILSIQPYQITYEPGRSYADITQYAVVLTDGAQYTTQDSFDCWAVGQRLAF